MEWDAQTIGIGFIAIGIDIHITTILMDDIQLTFIIRLQMQQEPEEVVDVEEVIGLEKTKAQFQILTHLAIFMVIVTYEADLTWTIIRL